MLRRRVTFHGSVPEGYKLRKILIGLVFLFLPAVAAAQTATVLANAPIYVTPVVTQSPLRVAAAGTTLQVLDDQGEWAKIAYNDPQWGRGLAGCSAARSESRTRRCSRWTSRFHQQGSQSR
jgi:hypothetical protein